MRKNFYFSVDVDWTPGSELGLRRLYDLCEAHRLAPAVFFTGKFAEVYPEYVREAVARGYDVGCHGWQHPLDVSEDFGSGNYEDQSLWVRRGTEAIAKAAGIRPVLFRAPNLSLTDVTLRVLQEQGYLLDSSVPARRLDFGVGGMKHLWYFTAPLVPYHPDPRNLRKPGDSPILEVPPSSFLVPLNMSALRAFGLTVLEWTVAQVASRTNTIGFYAHPCEFEHFHKQQFPPGTPRRYQKGLGPENLELLNRFVDMMRRQRYSSAYLSSLLHSAAVAV